MHEMTNLVVLVLLCGVQLGLSQQSTVEEELKTLLKDDFGFDTAKADQMTLDLKSLPGPKGRAGNTGPQGHAGPPGYPGSKGSPGEGGFDGIDGAPGDPGVKGYKGLVGRHGRRGSVGDHGVDGGKGEKGSKGLPGFPGLIKNKLESVEEVSVERAELERTLLELRGYYKMGLYGLSCTILVLAAVIIAMLVWHFRLRSKYTELRTTLRKAKAVNTVKTVPYSYKH